MYDNYYVRKQEITENVLMITICDVMSDGKTGSEGQSEEHAAVMDHLLQN